MSRKTTLILCALILGAGLAVTTLIFSTEPTASKSWAVRKSAMLVEVLEVERDTYRPTLQATGTVEPSREVLVSARVSGEVVHRAEAFTPGGYVREGETLLRIDPADYEIALEQAKSELLQAEADLHIEEGRQSVARRDYALLDSSLALGNEDLILRRPQMETVKARVQTARAAVKRAELDLERTRIRAPFDAHILSRNVNLGSQVAPGDNLGRLVGVDAYWIAVTLPVGSLRWLDFPEDSNGAGSPVLIRNRTAWEPGETRKGVLHRLVGALDDGTRMARVLVVVPDPLNRRSDVRESPPLMIGSFVDVTIEGRELPRTVRVDRDHLRGDDTVWVMEEGVLRIREVDVLVEDARFAYVTTGLEDGDRVITTNLSTVTDGAPLRVEGEPDAADSLSTPEAVAGD